MVCPIENLLKDAGKSELRGNKPVIGYGSVNLTRAAFHIGCSDYMKLPWNTTELVERALHIRIDTEIVFPWGTIYLTPQRIYSCRATSRICHYEYEIMAALTRFQGETVSREALGILLWGEKKEESRSLDMHVSNLRKKIKAHSPDQKAIPIKSVRGKGYRLICE